MGEEAEELNFEQFGSLNECIKYVRVCFFFELE